MKKFYYPLTIALIAGSAFFACKKDVDENPPVPPGGPDSVAYTLKDVQVNLPSGAGIDLASCTISSLSVDAKVNGQGKAQAAFNKGFSTIAWLFDKNNDVVMAGFITDSTAVIDVASTAKVLLYQSYYLAVQPYEVTGKFINGVHQVPGYTEWVTTFNQLFTQDAKVVSKGGFANPLKAAMEKLTENNVVDIRGVKASDIQVDAADIRSGLQVAPGNLSQFTITNSYRRRGHAFLYKKSYKDLDGKETVLPAMSGTSDPNKDLIVDPVAGISSFGGTVGAWIQGKAIEFAAVKSGPVELPLEDNESQAVYTLRIVGPGKAVHSMGQTQKEQSKLLRLEIETFALDFLFPVLMEMVGNKDDIKKLKGPDLGSGPVISIIEKTEALLKSMPAVYDEIRNSGNYELALRKFVEALLENGNSQMFSDMVKLVAGVLEIIAQQKYYVPRQDELFPQADRKLKILKIIDLCLFAGDLIRIGGNIQSSRQLESWEVIARASQVRLNPTESTTIPYVQVRLTATVVNFGTDPDVHPFFEWKTSGKFGKLTDTKGHTDQLAFESADAEVFYTSKVSNSALSEGDNIDYIYVTAYKGNKKVGTDTVTVNVKKDKYEIRPNDVIVSGKEDAQNEVRLYLEKADGYNGITANDSIDYKVIWTIAGKHGKLLGKEIDNTNTLTVYNDNQAWYECLDKDTKEGTEPVMARIYHKLRHEPESAFRLFDEAKGIIKINNDPKKKIMHIPTWLVHAEHNGCIQPGCNVCYKATVVTVPKIKDAISYTVKFYGQKKATIGANTVDSWTPENNDFSGPAHGTPKMTETSYTVLYSYGSRGSLPGNLQHVNGNGNPGMAEVVVILK